MKAAAREYRVGTDGERLRLVSNRQRGRVVAEFRADGGVPAPLAAVLAEQMAAAPEMLGLLLHTAEFFRRRPKSARKAGDLPDRIMALLRDLEADGWVK
jgi:hypothetical protein